MAASLITRTGNPSALEKLKPIQPLPKCFGFLVIRPLRTGTGKPMDALSNFQPRTFSLNLATNCFGPIRCPEGNSRSSRGDISNFTCVPPILGNLLHRPGAIELRRELGFVRSQL